jgi:uncharacterized protein (TIGR02421 family)
VVNPKLKIISNQFIDTVCKRLSENKQVRRSLPEWGRVHIDRQLPFLCIYRQINDEDLSLTQKLIMGEASYLIASGKRKQQKQLSNLVQSIAKTLKESFGSFLIVEIWKSSDGDLADENDSFKPTFKVFHPRKTYIASTIETLQKALNGIKIRKVKAETFVEVASKIVPTGLSPLLTIAQAKELGCNHIGIEVSPIYYNPKSGESFPIVRRELQKKFSRALKNSFFEFTNRHTPYRPMHYHSLGRWSMVKAVWEVDQQLAEICNGFDFLLQVTPTNDNSAWAEFQRNKTERMPEFIYRPLNIDPSHSKRKLYKIPIERIEDPTLAQLFREQQLELDRKFTMLIDRGTRKFLFGSLQVYGDVNDSLMKLATDILQKFSPRSRDESLKRFIDANAFAIRANHELSYFRKYYPNNRNKVIVRNDITGLMVSQGNLLIGANLKIPEERLEALIQHEVGTHVLTYLNGKAQPFRQLYVGLAGYEELQEGLAVLSEYLVGGLTRPRMRLLAARVVAAKQLIDGATFVEVFHELNKIYGFEKKTAFNITVRTFRGGGLTKDAVYLHGLVKLLDYIKKGGSLDTLFVGKIAAEHTGIINELQWRKVLNKAPLRPRYLDKEETIIKLKDLRNGLSVMNLIKRSKA